MISSGTGLAASFVGDWVGEWNLGPVDAFEVANLEGDRVRGRTRSAEAGACKRRRAPGGGRAVGPFRRGPVAQGDLYVHNTDWFGVISGRTGYSLERIYYRWIRDYRYGRNW